MIQTHAILIALTLGSLSASAQPHLAGQYSTDQSAAPVSTSPAWWTQLGGSSRHDGVSATPGVPGPYLTHQWTSIGDGVIEIAFTPQSGVVADDLHVYALGQDQSFDHHLAAFDQRTGELAWVAPVPFTILDSWSMPTIDAGNDTVIVAGSFEMVALDRFTGDPRWSLDFSLPLVNASPCVTGDLGVRDRVFITDYTFGTGARGSLYCINIDAFDAQNNPYQPGDLVWSKVLPGDCSGNTPAYRDGIVYVSTGDNGAGGAGHILAFDATSTSTPTPLWDTTNPQPLGFFSGLTYHNGSIYASSYNFHGTQRSANTIKLDATTGTLIWSVPTVRTDATPIVLPSGHVVISGGLPSSATSIFTGSLPAIELIKDHGSSATVLWDSFESTHEDLNSNGAWDAGEPYLSLGGWGHHPIAINALGFPKLLVGTMNPPTSFEPFTHAGALHTIDLAKHPADPGFIISTQPDVGNTPAIVGDRVYTTSDNGISMLTLKRAPSVQSLTDRVRSVVDGQRPIRELGPRP